MGYTDYEIKKNLEILHSFFPPAGLFREKASPQCTNCKNETSFFIDFGHKICDECGITNGHVLGYFDRKENDRLYSRKKSVYQRKYYYEKKIKQIPNLTEEESYLLYNKLMGIDEKVVKETNKIFNRKRMINIFYIINKCLEEMRLNQIEIHLSKETKNYYDRWWQTYSNAA